MTRMLRARSLCAALALTSLCKAQAPDLPYDLLEEMARMCSAVYQQQTFVIGSESRGYYQAPTFHNSSNGLQYAVYDRELPSGKRERVIAFRGTDQGKDMRANLGQGLWGPRAAAQYREALEVAQRHIAEADSDPDLQIAFTGHSLGGGLAQYVSVETGTRAYVFNSAPLRNTLLSGISQAEIDLAANNVWNLRSQADAVSLLPGIQLGQRTTIQPIRQIPLLRQAGEYGHHSMHALIDGMAHLRKGGGPGVTVSHKQEHYREVTRGGYRVRTYALAADSPDAMTTANLMTQLPHGVGSALVLGHGPQSYQVAQRLRGQLGESRVRHYQSGDRGLDTWELARAHGVDTVFHIAPSSALAPAQVSQPVRQEWSQPVSGPIGGGRVGGVMLRGAAEVSGAEGMGAGEFSLLFPGTDDVVDVLELRRFVTALWAVYFSEQGPGISIDPIAPNLDVHRVRYIGQVLNLDIGRVMRECDYAMKAWSVGTERPELPDFENPDDISARLGYASPNHSRFWFVPQDMRYSASEDALLFEGGSMALQTEYLDGRRGADPSNDAWAEWFTREYATISEAYPIFQEMFDYARLVGLARFLKEQRTPMLWYLLANKDLILTEDSPATVASFAQASAHFENMEIRGGVDLAQQLTADERAAWHSPGLSAAIQTTEQAWGTGSWDGAHLITPAGPVAVAEGQGLSLAATAWAGDVVQTDLALWNGLRPELELVRLYAPERRSRAEFGNGWHLLMPYAVEHVRDTVVELDGRTLPAELVVHNLLTGVSESLTLDSERYGLVGWLPRAEGSPLVGAFLLEDGGVRLVDRVGAEFQFAASGELTRLHLGAEYVIEVEYETLELSQAPGAEGPTLTPVDHERVTLGGISLPRRMRLTGPALDEVFRCDQDGALGCLGYLPESEDSTYRDLSLMTDGSFRLCGSAGVQVEFDPAGACARSQVRVVSALRRGSMRMDLRQEATASGARITGVDVKIAGESRPEYAVRYLFDAAGELDAVLKRSGAPQVLTYQSDRVVLSSN